MKSDGRKGNCWYRVTLIFQNNCTFLLGFRGSCVQNNLFILWEWCLFKYIRFFVVFCSTVVVLNYICKISVCKRVFMLVYTYACVYVRS